MTAVGAFVSARCRAVGMVPVEERGTPVQGQGGARLRNAGTPYRDTWLMSNSAPLGPYSRTVPRALWWS